MNPHIQTVLRYIEKSLDEPLSLERVARVAGYSPYHFSRIFKLYVGESVIAYASRLKLERAAKQMRYSHTNMIDIAMDAGYKTPTGFLKAFKARFGTTPMEYKKQSCRIPTYTCETPKIVIRPNVTVAYTRAVGDYIEGSQRAWSLFSDKLMQLEHNKSKKDESLNFDPQIGESLGIIHDDPQITNEENLRYDAAHSWGEAEMLKLKENGFEMKAVPGGRYAASSYHGISQGVAAWYGLYSWIEANGYRFRDEAPFEKYLNGAVEKDMEKLEVEIYVPLI